MNIDSMFPKTRFVEDWIKQYGPEKAFIKQLEKITEEMNEASQAYFSGDYLRTVEEVTDIMHSAHQLNYMNPMYKKPIGEIAVIKVIEKNNERDYYETKIPYKTWINNL
jgi:tryptophan synthase beta subunit